MSTLKTNNLQHLDSGSANIELAIGGGAIHSGISTFNEVRVESAIHSGISTFNKVRVGSATTFTDELVVNGDARITGILTIGTGSITLDPNNDEIKLGQTKLRRESSGEIKITDLQGNLKGLRGKRFRVQVAASEKEKEGIEVGTGATITSPADNVLSFRTNDQPRIRILSDGKVGIGTTIPVSLLTIRGDEGLYIQSNTNAVEAKIRFSSHISSDVDYGNPFADGAFQYGTISYNHSDAEAGNYYDGITYNERFLVQGTETRTKLQVNGDIWSVSEDGTTGKVAMIDGYIRSQRSISAGLIYHPDGTRTVHGTESTVGAYVNDTTTQTYLAAREANDWSTNFFSRYEGSMRHSMHANGHASHYKNLYCGRAFEQSSSGTPSSDYATSENSVNVFAGDAGDRTFIAARNVADTSLVFLSEVNDEYNIKFTASGIGYFDGNGDAGNADYAEYFEWEDGNPNNEDRVGQTVVIVPNSDGKIGIASTTDNPSLIIGVVSGAPGFVGDSAHFAWHGRYKCDEFNRKIMEPVEVYTYEGVDGEVEKIRKDRLEEGFVIPDNWTLTTTKALTLSDDYDANIPYTPREDRKEWSPIGLVGKLTVYKNQIKGDRWIKLKDINDQLEQWLVR